MKSSVKDLRRDQFLIRVILKVHVEKCIIVIIIAYTDNFYDSSISESDSSANEAFA
jgi:hypothetical protein